LDNLIGRYGDFRFTYKGKSDSMFQQLKKVLRQEKEPGNWVKATDENADWVNTHPGGEASSSNAQDAGGAQGGQAGSVWRADSGAGSGIQGMVQGLPWKLERAAASRNYISGEEIRGRADIAVDPQVTVIIMNRALKELLEKRAYALYTHSVETEASPTLMEEMRWLALYPQVGWESVADSFWHRYAVMTGLRAQAMGWVTPRLADLLMAWPEPAPAADTPFILMVMRGKVHLRMQLTPADSNTLNHITRVFTAATQSAVDVFSGNSVKTTKFSNK
jgi:hypothetical protein